MTTSQNTPSDPSDEETTDAESTDVEPADVDAIPDGSGTDAHDGAEEQDVTSGGAPQP